MDFCMVKFMKSWCEGIIVAIVISIIIEMILPEGNNKKYVKVILGIYIVFVVLNPMLSKLNNDFKIENFLNTENSIEVSSSVDDNIKAVYIKGIEENLKSEILENFGYEISNIEIKVDSDYENIEKIRVILGKKNSGNIALVEPIKISTNQEEDTEEFLDIKNFISENYEISVDNIKIIKD